MLCNYCGNQVEEGINYCPNCGEKPTTKKKNPNKEIKVVEKKETVSSDYSVLWGILGFFVPLVGLILFIIWKDEKPMDAKASGIGALIRVIFMFITIILFFFFFFFTTATFF